MKLQDGLFNLGGNNSMRIKDMAQLLCQRCEYVLGYVPELLIPIDDTGGHVNNHLNYRIDKLKELGFSGKQDLIAEIDELLLFCDSYFCIPNKV